MAQGLQTIENQEVQLKPNNSERFRDKVLRQFGTVSDGAIDVTTEQRELIQGYFLAIDRALTVAENGRVSKNNANSDHKYDNNLPYTWNNVNLNDLAVDLVHCAKLGLDMNLPNHLFPIPYQNKKTNAYDITLMRGYNGIRYIAERFALDPPSNVVIELVYDTDRFEVKKKSEANTVESYTFEITQPFSRGTIVGGFGYIEYADPQKNKLVLMSLADIMKRKPKSASAEFWGGVGKVYEKGKRVDAELEGWLDEMCRKTLVREVYSAKHIPIDPRKVTSSFNHMENREVDYALLEADGVIEAEGNVIPIDTTPEPPEQSVPTEMSEPESTVANAAPDATPDF